MQGIGICILNFFHMKACIHVAQKNGKSDGKGKGIATRFKGTGSCNINKYIFIFNVKFL